MLSSVLFFLAVPMIVLPILSIILPNFERQKRHSYMASILMKSEEDLRAMKQSSLVRAVVKGAEKKKVLDYVLGQTFRQMYNALDRKEGYEFYIFKIFMTGLLMGSLPFALYMIKPEEKVLLIASPILVGLFLFRGIKKIMDDHDKRQRTLIRDLPKLISQMISALEIGKPLIDIFGEAAQNGKNELLSSLLKRLLVNTDRMPMEDALHVFAEEINIPVFYDFVSVVNVAVTKGFREAEPDLDSIKNDLRELNRLSLIELTSSSPAKMNIFYGILLAHVVVLLGMTVVKVFSQLTAL